MQIMPSRSCAAAANEAHDRGEGEHGDLLRKLSVTVKGR